MLFTVSVCNVWAQASKRRDSISPDYHKVEELFCQQTITKAEPTATEQKKKKSEEVKL